MEPSTTEDRLLWHCQRAIEWVRSASKGELVLPGEPFEIPHVPPFCKVPDRFQFSEGAIDASPWSHAHISSGRARCFNLSANEKMWFFEMFMGPKNEDLIQVPWGQHVTRLRGKTWDGVWLRLPNIPAVKPFRFPETWGELRQALSEQGVSLKETLGPITRHLRDGEVHFLLIGFPIPAVYKGPAAVMNWIAIAIPVLSRHNQYPNGFRPNDQGFLENDMRTIFRWEKRLVYMPTDNWHPEQIQSRGRFQEGLRSSRVAITGCGAAIPVMASDLKAAGISIYLEQVKRDGNLLDPLWSQGEEIFQWQRTSSYRQTSYSH